MPHHFDPSVEAELSHRRTALQREATRHHLSRLARRRTPRPTHPSPHPTA